LDEKKEKSDVCLLLLTEKSSKIHPVCLLFFVHVVVVGVVGVVGVVALEHELYRHSVSKDEEVLALALVLCASQRA
jgi:F0F1-type ATP synthase membrane subunit a